MPQANDLDLVLRVLGILERAGVSTWISGGWAEELRGLRPVGGHGDIDLLYPAGSFEILDAFLARSRAVAEIPLKRFSHKRAFELEKVMIEITLVEQENDRYVTRFFAGLHTFIWPGDTFQWMPVGPHPRLPVASDAAIKRYRENHAAVERAYQAFQG